MAPFPLQMKPSDLEDSASKLHVKDQDWKASYKLSFFTACMHPLGLFGILSIPNNMIYKGEKKNAYILSLMEALMNSLHLLKPRKWEIITVVSLKTSSVLLQKNS